MNKMDRPKNASFSVQMCPNQQESSSVIIWVEIVNNTIIGPFKIDEEVKLNRSSYCDFIDKTLLGLYKS